jgi:hypothetical protein
MPREHYVAAHQGLVIACHDVFIRYNYGILLVERKGLPARGMLWPIGGRISRGMSIEDSLRVKTEEECGLKLENLKELGHPARVFFRTDPFGHGKGTDTIGHAYSADGIGEINLNHLHQNPTIVLPEQYPLIRTLLHPYVRDFMDMMVWI